MPDMKLIMENWNGFLNEQPSPGSIQTIGQLYDFFRSQEPGLLKKLSKIRSSPC